MTIPAPFKTPFPLTTNPFRSRVEAQTEEAKNYYAVAFKPGYPLQASELNEIQEIFYVQQTLTQEMISFWMDYSILSSASTSPLVTGPGWQGCTPLKPDLIGKNSETNSITLTALAGWYLVKHTDINSGFGVWVYNNTNRVIVSGLTKLSSGSTTTTYGIIVKPITIQCTQSEPSSTEDISLQDQSSINVVNGPCGAARMQLKVIGFGSSAGTGEYLAPILTGIANAATAQATFSNNYVIKTTTP